MSDTSTKLTFGQRAADVIARVGKSWAFLLSLNIFIAIWMISNDIVAHPWDVYPYILLNLFLSWLAANQAPVIMMSQGRQEAILWHTIKAILTLTKAMYALLQDMAKIVGTLPEELDGLDSIRSELGELRELFEELDQRIGKAK